MPTGQGRIPAAGAPNVADRYVRLDRTTTTLLAAIVALGLVLRVPGLGESVWFDELFSTRLYLYSAGALFRTAARDLHPPFHTLLMFGWIRAFGDSEVAIRIPPLLFGLGSIVLAFAVARRFMSERGSLLAALLLALSPVHIWYSQEARQYSAGIFFTLLAAYAQYRVLENARSKRWLWGYAGAVVLLAMTHFYHVAIIAALAMIALSRGGAKSRPLVRIDVAVVFALAVYIVGKVEVGGLTTQSGHLIPFTPVALWRLLFEWFLTGGSLWLSTVWDTGAGAALRVATGIAALVIVLLGVRTLADRPGRAAIEPVLLLLALPALLLAMNVVGFGRVYIERSALPALPFFLLLLAAGADTIARAGRTLVLAVVVALAAVPTIGLFLHRDVWTVYKPNPDWRSAADRLREYQDGAEPLIVFAATPATALNYYGLDLSEREAALADVVGTAPAPVQPGGGLKRRLNEWTAYGGAEQFPPSFLSGGRHELILLRDPPVDSVIAGVLDRTGTTRLVVVLNRFWPNEVGDALDDLDADPGYRMVGRASFLGLDVAEYRLVR